jgi:putative transposase
LLACYAFPKAHWMYLRTTNPEESPFAAARQRTAAAQRFKKVANATAMWWNLLMMAKQRFRRLHAPEVLAKVAAGVRYENGFPAQPGLSPERIAA